MNGGAIEVGDRLTARYQKRGRGLKREGRELVEERAELNYYVRKHEPHIVNTIFFLPGNRHGVLYTQEGVEEKTHTRALTGNVRREFFAVSKKIHDRDRGDRK